MKELDKNLLDPKDSSINGVDESEEAEGNSTDTLDNAMAGMKDTVDSQTDSSGSSVNAVNLDEDDIRKIWAYVSGFNKSEPIREKKNSKDGLMTKVCEGVENLKKITTSAESSAFDSMLEVVIGRCNEYIAKKNPWLPRGQRRKQAVIDLRDGLQALSDCKDKGLLNQAIAIQDTFGTEGRAGIQTNDPRKEAYSDQIKNGLKNESEKDDKTVKGLKGTNKELSYGRNIGMMTRMMNHAGIINGDKAGTQKAREWAANFTNHDDKINYAKAQEPLYDMLMSAIPESFMLDSPDSLKPVSFIDKFRVLQLAEQAYTGTEEYGELIKSKQGKYQSNFAEVLKRINFFNALLPIYKNLYDVIINPEYSNYRADIFKMLRYSREKILTFRDNSDSMPKQSARYRIMGSLAEIKGAMQNSGFDFGDKSCFAKMMAAAGDDAADTIKSYGL